MSSNCKIVTATFSYTNFSFNSRTFLYNSRTLNVFFLQYAIVIYRKEVKKMLLQLSNIITNYFLKKEIIGIEKKEVLIYGFQLTFSTLSSIITILIFSCLINIFYGIIFLIFFMPIRFCSGGYHANTYLKCFIYTNSCFVIILLFSKIVLHLDLLNTYALLAFIGILYLWLKAPCKNANNPLSEKYIQYNRFITHIILAIYAIICIITYHISPFMFLIEFNTVFLVSILFIIGSNEK